MTKIYDLFKSLKKPFVPQQTINILLETKEFENKKRELVLKDTQDKLNTIKLITKNCETFKEIISLHYALLAYNIDYPKTIEIVTMCKEKSLYLEEIAKQVVRLFNLLETLNLRLTEKITLIKNYDFNNDNNEEINKKLKNLTEKINKELVLLAEIYPDFCIGAAKKDWDESRSIIDNYK